MATRRRDELAKQRRLESLQSEIRSLKQGRSSASRSRSGRSDTPVSSVSRGTKRAAVEMDTVVERPRKIIRPEKLPIYHGKTVREHREFIRECKGAFRLTPENFPTDESKIIWARQYLDEDQKKLWVNEEDKNPDYEFTWQEFIDFLLNQIEDPVNRGLDIAQQYTDAYQRQNQTVRQFDNYLRALKS